MGKLAGLAKEQRRALDRLKAVDLLVLGEAIGATLPDVAVLGSSDVSLRLRVGDVPVDLVRYPYAPLDPPEAGRAAVPVAGLRDLAAMKLAAIARRGLRRDFWDLYALAQAGLPLREVADAYLEKFGVKEADLYHALKTLTYFSDAEKDPELPRGLSARRWEAIKAFFRAEAPKLLKAR